MKTSIELDEKKVELAKRLGHVSTTRDLIDRALDAYIAKARRESVVDLLGTDFFDASLERARKNRSRQKRVRSR